MNHLPALKLLCDRRILGFHNVNKNDQAVSFFEGSTEHFGLDLNAENLCAAASELRNVIQDESGVKISTPTLDLFASSRVCQFDVEEKGSLYIEDGGTGAFGTTFSEAEVLQLANDFENLAQRLVPQPKMSRQLKP